MSSPTPNSTSLRFKTFRQTNNVPSARDSARDAGRLDHILDHNMIESDDSMEGMRCCCGSDACAYLEKNAEALFTIERQLAAASRMGSVSTLQGQSILLRILRVTSRNQDFGITCIS